MKILFKTSALLLLLTLLFTACNKENVDELSYNEPVNQVDTVGINPLLSQMKTYATDTIYMDCIKIPLPVSFLQASGTSITVNTSSELDAALQLSDSLVDFIYPFQVLDSNGTIQINLIDDLMLALINCASQPAQCADLEPHVILFFNALNILTINKYEYDIIYPVSIIVEGNTVVLTKDDDYLPAIGGSPFNFKETELVYPISVRQFGRTLTFANDNDVCDFYQTLDEPCANKPAHIAYFFNEGNGTPINCTYFVNYPVNITLNGSPLQINSRADYLNLLNNTVGAYNNIRLDYPVSIAKWQGNTNITFGSDSDICNYLNNCQ